ncbi:3580_t:CDS:2 [Cetraspora pellucida]|uniref:3580_t:CDS:1 n=1 Tax=Cetraspora pellucida TaxID=1433469 RepID=A0A9N9DWA4_9GLOM|nr:3580_t:CDS:2 [Cetraspora pellucida]
MANSTDVAENKTIYEIDLTTDTLLILSLSPSISFMTNETTSETTSEVASEVTSKDSSMSSDDDSEFELGYKLIIKTVEGISLSAKWFKESMSTVDEFLLSIHNKLIMLTKDNTLLPTDYSIAFKAPRETGVSTQLADAHDFIKFKTECLKLVAKKNDMEIYIMIMETTQIKQNKKASNMNKGMVMINDPPTYPLFSHTKTFKKLRSSALSSSQALLLFSEVPFLFSEALSPSSQAPLPSLQAPLPFSQALLSSLQSLQAPFILLPQALSQTLFVPLSQNNWTYGPLAFQLFSLPFNLYQFKKQEVSVKNLKTLSNEAFKECGVKTVGAQQTLHDYTKSNHNYMMVMWYAKKERFEDY